MKNKKNKITLTYSTHAEGLFVIESGMMRRATPEEEDNFLIDSFKDLIQAAEEPKNNPEKYLTEID